MQPEDKLILFHWSPFVITFTIIMFAVIIYAAVRISSSLHSWWGIAGIIIVVGTLVYTIHLCPLYIKVTDDDIKIKRPFNSIIINKDSIKNIKSVSKSTVKNSIRVMGSWGMFGYLGRYDNKELGTFYMYASELNNLILIETPNKKYIVSCRKPELLIKLTVNEE